MHTSTCINNKAIGCTRACALAVCNIHRSYLLGRDCRVLFHDFSNLKMYLHLHSIHLGNAHFQHSTYCTHNINFVEFGVDIIVHQCVSLRTLGCIFCTL